MEIFDEIKSTGSIIATITYKNKPQEIYRFPNLILANGKNLLTKFIAGQIKEPVFITNMLFGDGGFDQGKPRTVKEDRNSLFGVTRLNKPVVAQIDPVNSNQSIFTAVVAFEDANGVGLSEMALKMSNGNLFSIATFPILTKTEDIQVVYNWRITNL